MAINGLQTIKWDWLKGASCTKHSIHFSSPYFKSCSIYLSIVKDELQAFLGLLVPTAIVLRIGVGRSCVDLKVGKLNQVGTNYIHQIYNQKFNAPNHVLSIGSNNL
jgi:hypothetical protein